MISIAALRGNVSYFEQNAKADYYEAGGGPRGRYLGSGAALLGLKDEIKSRDTLRNLFNGKSPDGKESYVQVQHGKERQPGWDLAFTPSKSTSLAFALADDSLRGLILVAHREAVATALSYLEDEAAWTRRGKGGARVEKAALVAVAYDHFTSREGDPNLHTHVLVLNQCVRADGSTGTLRSRDLYLHRVAADAVYRAELARKLRDLGLGLRKGRHSFELEAVSDAIIDAFSKRRAAIKEHMAREGTSGAKAAEAASLATRPNKIHEPLVELLPRWRVEAAALGLTALPALAPARRSERSPVPAVAARAARALAAREATFFKRDLLAQTGKETEHLGLGAHELRRAIHSQLQSEELELLNAEGRFSTKEHMQLEKQLIQLAEASKEDRSHIVSTKHVVVAERRAKQLSFEQHEALHHLTIEPGAMKLVSGWAGTGKTTLLRAARDAWERQGLTVIGAAPSKTAARELEHSAGIRTRTLASLSLLLAGPKTGPLQHAGRQLFRAARGKKTWKQERQRLGPKTVLVLDEASMISTQDMRIVQHARARGAKVVLVGDTGQLPAIEAGGVFAGLERVLGAAMLTDIRRQKAWQREASRALADGAPHTALALYVEHGRARLLDTPLAAKRALIAEWSKERDLSQTLVLASTRADVSDLNRLAQAARKERGELGLAYVTVGNEKIYKGDRVRLTKNNHYLDIANGDRGTVVRIVPSAFPAWSKVVVELDATPGAKARRVTLSLGAYPHFALGYAETVHSAQGQTKNKALVLMGGWASNRELTYVGLTRHRDSLKLFMNELESGEDLTELLRAMQKSRAKEMALQVAERIPDVARKAPGHEVGRDLSP